MEQVIVERSLSQDRQLSQLPRLQNGTVDRRAAHLPLDQPLRRWPRRLTGWGRTNFSQSNANGENKEDEGSEPICRDNILGKCASGVSCKFWHGDCVSFEEARFSRNEQRCLDNNVDMQKRCLLTEDRSRPPCRKFQSGSCCRGSSCPYMHSGCTNYERPAYSYANVHNGLGAPSRNRSRLPCRKFQSGSCYRGSSCSYLHSGCTNYEKPTFLRGSSNQGKSCLNLHTNSVYERTGCVLGVGHNQGFFASSKYHRSDKRISVREVKSRRIQLCQEDLVGGNVEVDDANRKEHHESLLANEQLAYGGSLNVTSSDRIHVSTVVPFGEETKVESGNEAMKRNANHMGEELAVGVHECESPVEGNGDIKLCDRPVKRQRSRSRSPCSPKNDSGVRKLRQDCSHGGYPRKRSCQDFVSVSGIKDDLNPSTAKSNTREMVLLNELTTKSKRDQEPIIKVQDNVVGSSCATSISRRKLLVLDVNGLLADIVGDFPDEYEPDIIVSRKGVFKRPFCDDFLRFCLERFDVGIWSSRLKKNVMCLVYSLLKRPETKKFLFCWDQSHCTQTGYKTLENQQKPLVLKDLNKLWENRSNDLPWKKGNYNETNTVLLDDSPYKALRNPPYTAVFPFPYSYTDEKDNSLGPNGDLRLYLERLAEAENVQKFIQENPFGQRRITEAHPSWSFYSKIVEPKRAKKKKKSA